MKISGLTSTRISHFTEDHIFLAPSLGPHDLLHDGFGPCIRHQRWETHRSRVTERGERRAYMGFGELLSV